MSNQKPLPPVKADPLEALLKGKTAPTLALPSDTGRSIRTGLLMLALGFGGFIAWAVTAPLDEGVPTMGLVSVEAKRKSVQHLSGGLISELLVHEAQQVKAGEPLIRLNDIQTRANRDAATQNWYALTANEARLEAEQTAAGAIRFPGSLTQAGSAPLAALAREHMEAQQRLFTARRLALQSDLAVFNESARNLEAQAQGLDTQIRLLEQQLGGIRQLTAEGYAPRNRLLELERQMSDLQSNALRARTSANEMRLRVTQRQQEFRREVETQLAEVTRQRAEAEERMRILDEELKRAVILSPADGQVLGLAVHTVGGVVSPGQKLMDIIPADAPLLIEAHIPSHVIDRVHPGLLADVNLHTFASRPELLLQGRVISISADLVADPNPNMPPYYLARIEVTPEGLKKLGHNQLQPGMPADVVIKTGERTMMTYLMKPLLRRLNASLTEN